MSYTPFFRCIGLDSRIMFYGCSRIVLVELVAVSVACWLSSEQVRVILGLPGTALSGGSRAHFLSFSGRKFGLARRRDMPDGANSLPASAHVVVDRSDRGMSVPADSSAKCLRMEPQKLFSSMTQRSH